MLPWLLLLLAVFGYLLDKLVNKRSWDLLCKIPGPKPWPIIGNIMDIGILSSQKTINPITVFFQRREGMTLLFRKAKMNILWIGRDAIVFLSTPETVEPVLSSNTALEKGRFYKYLKPWLAEGLVMSQGDKWRHHRKLLTSSFHFRILDSFVPIMNTHTEILVRKILEASMKVDWIDSFEYYSKCTLDIICETSMGIKIGAQEADSTYSQKVHNASYAVSLRSGKPWLTFDSVYFMTANGKEFLNSVRYLHEMTDKVISEKISEKVNAPTNSTVSNTSDELGTKKRMAFLDLLLESGLSKQETREQVDTFMFAGHDTTATALSWMTYLLGLYPHVQDRVIEEVDSIFAGDKTRDVTQEDLRKLKYMDMVMKESQRVYPSVPGVSRTLDKDTQIGDYLIPKGTECFVSIYSVHHDPDHYPNPDIFDPERFSPENSSGRHPYAFVPFSAGPRNCIGQRFALMEQKIIACHILRNFQIQSLDERDKLHLVPELVLRTDKSIRTKFVPRV